MEPKEQDRGEFLVEQEQRLEAISDLVPYAQRLLFDWRHELTATTAPPSDASSTRGRARGS